MFSKFSLRLWLIVCIVSLGAPLALMRAPVARAFPDNCGLHPSNLFRNGSMAPGHDTQWGVVSTEWEPFVISGGPRFEWVDNEKWDANGAQYFWADATPFDAGIRQTVGGLQNGVYYRFRIGYSHARLDPGTTTNDVHPSMGRQVGVDPTGGTDPRSANVLWGSALFNSDRGMNPAELTMTFAARADKATIFFRGIFKGASGRAKVWFDVACMEVASDMPTATPLAPTATTIPPTPTTRPSPTRAPATRVAQAPDTPTPPPTATAIPATSTPTETPPPTATARFARPIATTEPQVPVSVGAGAVIGLGAMLVMGAMLFFGMGILWWRRVS